MTGGLRLFIAWSLCVLIVSVLGCAVTPANESTVTIYAHPIPPLKYRDEKFVTVRFTYDIHGICSSIEKLPDNGKYLACYDSETLVVYMPHPCANNRIDQEYAQLMCHELGHANGWKHD